MNEWLLIVLVSWTFGVIGALVVQLSAHANRKRGDRE